MSKVVLINPSHRPKRRARKPASAAQRRARANFAAAARSRRKNPARRRHVAVRSAVPVRHRRRRNPIHKLAHHTRRRRRNPIGGLGISTTSIVAQIKAALMGGAGAVAMDVIMGQANKYLPTSLQSNSTSVGVGDAVKAALTVALGQLLRKPSKGMSLRLAQGALTVQAADILRSFVPPSMTMGYYSPGRIVRGTSRVGPNMQHIAPGMGRYLPPGGASPLLSRYQDPGITSLLNGNSNKQRSNVRIR